jgi:hypothetical protein
MYQRLTGRIKNSIIQSRLKDWPKLIAIFNKDIAEKYPNIFNNENLKFLSDNLGASGKLKKNS